MSSLLIALALSASTLQLGSCDEAPAARSSTLRATLVHLEDELGSARVDCAEVPRAAREQRAWSFAEPRPEWRVVSAEEVEGLAAVELAREADRIRITLRAPPKPTEGLLVGGIAVDLGEETSSERWAGVLVRARTHERLAGIGVVCNVADEGAIPGGFGFFMGAEGTAPVFSDGSEQSYMLPLPARCAGSLRNVGVVIGAPGPGSIEILSVALVPRGASFLEDLGVHPVTRGPLTMRTLFVHAPASLVWRVVVPPSGRLDLALTCVEGESVSYRVTAGAPGAERERLLDERVEDSSAWRQRSVDLSRWSGREIELGLEATSDAEGAVALFGAPILSGAHGSRDASRPNVIFYVIDGGGADLMSLYGYNRRTTPFLERLAEEGVVFERAYSNSTWTQPSTASFMTSLHHSVLGGLRRGVHSTPVPAAATTMAEHMRRGGYETASFTTNPNAARVIGLERGVDVMSDARSRHHSTSSTDLHELFWRFRRDYPGTPYWVHIQTTDVHEPNEPAAPFAGLFVTAEQRAELDDQDRRMFEAAGDLFGTTSIAAFYDAALEKAGIDRQAYFNARRGLYDETMAHQDRELERFVGRLKAQGEWESTLLVVAADHGHPAGTFARFGRGLFEPQPEGWQGALFDSYATRIPLLFVWPGHIPGGRRIPQAVSMIDVLPTLLELVELPQPDVLQGRSLAPLLRGAELAPRRVVFDEFRVDERTGEMIGNLEVIDGRWGASLEIGPGDDEPELVLGRHALPAGGRWGAVHPYFAEAPRLLLYDLWNDPFALHAVNDEHPEEVERYRRELLELWRAHQALGLRFGEAGEQALTPETLQQLRSLGYVR